MAVYNRTAFTFERAEILLDLDPEAMTQANMLTQLRDSGAWERDHTKLLLDVLQPGDVFVDVGAHIGYFTTLASKLVGPTGRVVALEPCAENFPRLLHHLRLNGCENVIPHYCAATQFHGETILHINEDNDGGHSLWPIGEHPLCVKTPKNARKQLVWQQMLDDLLVPYGCIKILKIDAEGSELGVLLGAQKVFANERQKPKHVIVEVGPLQLSKMGTNEGTIRQWMHERGYLAYLHMLDGSKELVDIQDDVKIDAVYNMLFSLPE